MSYRTIFTDEEPVSHTAQSPALPLSFYVKWLRAVGLLILLGFISSYVMQFSSLTEVHHWHAAVSLLWIAGMLVQVTLIHQQRFICHRVLGYWLLCILLAFIGSTLWLYSTVYQARINTAAIFRLVLSLDLMLFPAFIVFMCNAIFRSNSPHAHAHWILLAAVMLLPPGLGRLIHGLFFFPLDAPVRFFYEPTVAVTGIILWQIGCAEHWRYRSTKVCLVLFITATVASYGVAYLC
ncbi:hypothetical protein [Pseudoalteromonas sp. OOF1S-7]|uniref:hypothetical protein n=1 Tax=Pseudoalteromonas sp. OOF1S-7 TaxID=2917757 RepID=UPI001EF6A353|nr:hypothetical protein [Pseudoalteromonas sp. OOF1S-7]MCG7533586.1 hypothetical protein [Pseudoalteromonas sp. OOF1S-7]